VFCAAHYAKERAGDCGFEGVYGIHMTRKRDRDRLSLIGEDALPKTGKSIGEICAKEMLKDPYLSLHRGDDVKSIETNDDFFAFIGMKRFVVCSPTYVCMCLFAKKMCGRHTNWKMSHMFFFCIYHMFWIFFPFGPMGGPMGGPIGPFSRASTCCCCVLCVVCCVLCCCVV